MRYSQHRIYIKASSQEGIAYIELYPLDEDKNFTKIGIQVKTADSSIEEVKSFGKDGNNLIIKIKNIKQPTPVPADSFFKFDTAAHPEVEVIDMR
ncbi:MAG: LolA family protein [Odoribacter splanchnicus]